MPAHDVPKIVAIAGQRIGMLSHAATSIADLGKDTDGEPRLSPAELGDARIRVASVARQTWSDRCRGQWHSTAKSRVCASVPHNAAAHLYADGQSFLIANLTLGSINPNAQ